MIVSFLLLFNPVYFENNPAQISDYREPCIFLSSFAIVWLIRWFVIYIGESDSETKKTSVCAFEHTVDPRLRTPVYNVCTDEKFIGHRFENGHFPVSRVKLPYILNLALKTRFICTLSMTEYLAVKTYQKRQLTFIKGSV